MTCPECGGKGYVELFISSVPCSLCELRKELGDKAVAKRQATTSRRCPGPTPDWSSPELAALKPAESFAHPAEVRDRVQSWSRRLAEIDTSTDAVFMRKNAEVGEWRPVYDRHCPPGKRVEQRTEGSQVGFRLVDAHPNEEWVDCEGFLGALGAGSTLARDGRCGEIVAHDSARERALVRWDEQRALPENSEWVEIETPTCLFEVGERIRYAGRYAKVLEVEPGGGRMLVRWEEPKA